MIVSLSIVMALAQTGGCIPVHGDHILARDVAAVMPEFAALAADSPISFSPEPGFRRVIRAHEMAGLGKARGLTLASPQDTCFAWQMMPPKPDAIVAAMRNALQQPAANFEIRSITPATSPPGEITFPKNSLLLPPAGISRPDLVWHGYILYGDNRRFAITARVKITTSTTRVVATQDLTFGQPIPADHVKVETCEDFPLDRLTARTLADVVGRVPNRLVRAGSAILKNQVSDAPEVATGDSVQVEVRSGQARLTLDGRAESSGMRGSVVIVRNLQTNKMFRARVVDKDKVVVSPGGISR